MSHLLQMRGLKHPSGGYQVVRAMSHLLQMRGLKLKIPPYWQAFIFVASFTDAWIETLGIIPNVVTETSHLLQMRGLKQRRGNPRG